MSATAPLLECRDLQKSYTHSDGKTVILKDTRLILDRGQTAAIVGPSGCGKSTLLNLIGTLDRPDAGEILIDGEDISRFDDAASARFRNLELGFIFQEHHLLPQCSVLENVLVPTMAPGSLLKGKAAVDKGTDLLGQVGLSHRLNHRPAQLSGGERQRAAVARALIQSPKLLLADEPTGSLDGDTAQQLTELLLEMSHSHGLAMLVVTHATHLADQMARCFALNQGKLVLQEGVA